MKKVFFTALLFAIYILHPAFCHSQTWQWAKNAAGNNDDGAFSVTADASGNAYVAGYFGSSTITFGSTTLNNVGADDVFVVKYDANGNALWAKSAGGIYSDYATSVSTDASGNVLVAGWFASNSITFGSTTLVNAGIAPDIFIAKYDSNGNVLWAKSAGGTFSDQATSVSTDTSGNVLVTGYFFSPSIAFGSDTLNNPSGPDMFVVKYDANGNVLWAKSANGGEAHAVTTDASCNIYVAGWFVADSFIVGSDTLNYAGTDDMFIVKYNTNGNALWAKSAGSTSYDHAHSLSADTIGNIYVTGVFQSDSIVFGSDTLFNPDISGNTADIFIVKYNSNGNVLWAKSAGGNDFDEAYSVTAEVSGNIYVAGWFASSAIVFGSDTLINGGSRNIFIVKYDGSGNCVWAKNEGGGTNDIANSVITDASGNIYVTGYFGSSSITFGSTTLNNAGFFDMFIAKLSSITGITEANSENGMEIYPNPTHNLATFQFNHTKSNNGINLFYLYNVLGRKIREEKFNSSEFIFDRGNLSDGIYFYKIVFDDSNGNENNLISSGKIIIE